MASENVTKFPVFLASLQSSISPNSHGFYLIDCVLHTHYGFPSLRKTIGFIMAVSAEHRRNNNTLYNNLLHLNMWWKN